jgi:hypothetical protein
VSHQVDSAIALQQLLTNLQRERSELLLAMVADNLQDPRLSHVFFKFFYEVNTSVHSFQHKEEFKIFF